MIVGALVICSWLELGVRQRGDLSGVGRYKIQETRIANIMA